MVDVAQFSRKFDEWRGTGYYTGYASKEQYAIQTAILIGNYFNGTSINDITNYLVDDSDIFEAFNAFSIQNPRARLYGTLVFFKLALEEYLRDEALSEPERQLLTRLRTNIETVYTRTTIYHPGNLITGPEIKEQSASWLNDYALTSANPALAKDLCKAIYLALRIISLDQDETLIKHPERRGELYDLAISSKNQATIIEAAMLAPQPPPPPPPLADEGEDEAEEFFDLDPPQENGNQEAIALALPGPVHGEDGDDDEFGTPRESPLVITPSTYFNQQALAILAAQGATLQEKLVQIKASLDVAHRAITQLIAQKHRVVGLENQVSHAQSILEAINTDDRARVKSKTRVLIHANQTAFDALIGKTSIEVQGAWQRRLAPEPHPRKEALKAVACHVIPSLQYRLTTDDEVEHRAALAELAQNSISAMYDRNEAPGVQIEGELDALQREMDTTLAPLTGELNEAVKNALKESFISELEELCRVNRATHDVLTAFEPVIIRIHLNQAKLRNCIGANNAINDFIAKYDSIFVTLSLLLSHYISSIFKTDTADKVDQIRQKKKEIEEWDKNYRRTIPGDIDTISRHGNISLEIKGELVTILQDPANTQPEPTPPLENDTIISRFNLIETMFQNARPPPPPAPAEGNQPAII